ncbi:hypothetical protein C8R44DRAFT_735085 [Mycena epipterygia]|nr:hypothetical protein C8R44DRAFT_735085 [Mycena epipterygia]
MSHTRHKLSISDGMVRHWHHSERYSSTTSHSARNEKLHTLSNAVLSELPLPLCSTLAGISERDRRGHAHQAEVPTRAVKLFASIRRDMEYTNLGVCIVTPAPHAPAGTDLEASTNMDSSDSDELLKAGRSRLWSIKCGRGRDPNFSSGGIMNFARSP